MRFKTEKVSLSDPRVLAELTAATGGDYPQKILLDRAYGIRGKKILRAHKDRAGRFYVVVGRSSRCYLADRCTVISFDGHSPIITFELDMGNGRIAA